MVELLGPYKRHLVDPASGQGGELHPGFDEKAFLEAAPPTAQPFLAAMRGAQLFEVFVAQHATMTPHAQQQSAFERAIKRAGRQSAQPAVDGGAASSLPSREQLRERAAQYAESLPSREQLRNRAAGRLRAGVAALSGMRRGSSGFTTGGAAIAPSGSDHSRPLPRAATQQWRVPGEYESERASRGSGDDVFCAEPNSPGSTPALSLAAHHDARRARDPDADGGIGEAAGPREGALADTADGDWSGADEPAGEGEGASDVDLLGLGDEAEDEAVASSSAAHGASSAALNALPGVELGSELGAALGGELDAELTAPARDASGGAASPVLFPSTPQRGHATMHAMHAVHDSPLLVPPTLARTEGGTEGGAAVDLVGQLGLSDLPRPPLSAAAPLDGIGGLEDLFDPTLFGAPTALSPASAMPPPPPAPPPLLPPAPPPAPATICGTAAACGASGSLPQQARASTCSQTPRRPPLPPRVASAARRWRELEHHPRSCLPRSHRPSHWRVLRRATRSRRSCP